LKIGEAMPPVSFFWGVGGQIAPPPPCTSLPRSLSRCKAPNVAPEAVVAYFSARLAVFTGLYLHSTILLPKILALVGWQWVGQGLVPEQQSMKNAACVIANYEKQIHVARVGGE